MRPQSPKRQKQVTPLPLLGHRQPKKGICTMQDKIERQRQIEQQLLDLYGPILTKDHLAKILHRSPEGLAYTLARKCEFSDSVNSAKLKLGRRIYFRASDIAALLVNGGSNA